MEAEWTFSEKKFNESDLHLDGCQRTTERQDFTLNVSIAKIPSNHKQLDSQRVKGCSFFPLSSSSSDTYGPLGENQALAEPSGCQLHIHVAASVTPRELGSPLLPTTL